MELRTKFWIGAGVFFGPILIGLATPDSAPAWILHVEDIVVLVECVPLGLLILLAVAALFVPARTLNPVMDRLVERFTGRKESTVREVPAPNGIQVLGTFLNEDANCVDEVAADRYGEGGVR